MFKTVFFADTSGGPFSCKKNNKKTNMVILFQGGQGFYSIAHLTNNIFAVDWAVCEGANTLEIELQFKDDGTPSAFFHSSICDCCCMCPT